jgi:hypothetical protein
VVLGKTVGQTKVYATIAGHSDSATVTVVAGPPPQPMTKPQPLASFDLNVSSLATDANELDAGAAPTGSPYAATITGFGALTVSPYLAQFKLSRKTP